MELANLGIPISARTSANFAPPHTAVRRLKKKNDDVADKQSGSSLCLRKKFSMFEITKINKKVFPVYLRLNYKICCQIHLAHSKKIPILG